MRIKEIKIQKSLQINTNNNKKSKRIRKSNNWGKKTSQNENKKKRNETLDDHYLRLEAIDGVGTDPPAPPGLE